MGLQLDAGGAVLDLGIGRGGGLGLSQPGVGLGQLGGSLLQLGLLVVGAGAQGLRLLADLGQPGGQLILFPGQGLDLLPGLLGLSRQLLLLPGQFIPLPLKLFQLLHVGLVGGLNITQHILLLKAAEGSGTKLKLCGAHDGHLVSTNSWLFYHSFPHLTIRSFR